MVKYVPHTCGKWACILTRSLEATKCGHEVSSPIKWIMRNSKIWSLIYEVPKHDPIEVQQSSQTFNNSWIKWSAKSHSQQGEKLWSWAKKLPLQVLDKWSPSDTKVSYKSWSMLCLKSALNEVQIKGSELQWNKNLCAISEVNLQTLNCKVTQVNMESQPSLMHKNKVKFYFITFQSSSHRRALKYFCLEKNSSASFHQLSSHRKVEVDCPHTKLKTSDGSSYKVQLSVGLLNQVTNAFRSSRALQKFLLTKARSLKRSAFANWKERSMLKIHTATSSVQLYLLSGRSSSCALPSWSPILRICSSTLSIRAQDLAMQYWSCFFTRSSSSWWLKVTPTASLLPAAVWTK